MNTPEEYRLLQVLYEDPDAQRILHYLTKASASTAFSTALALGMDPERVYRLLDSLESVNLVERIIEGTASNDPVFSPTVAGVKASRELSPA
jgi:DNA-binding MarR family transcriptional regulator